MALLKKLGHLRISLNFIKLATNSFDAENVVGVGGFGKVYRGEITSPDGLTKAVAVKRLDRKYGQGECEFLMEILILSRYRHKNIVSLLGFCDEEDEKILVYEYEANGSLEKHLRSKALTWVHRLKISIGAARGLAYLHNPFNTQQRVLHRDVKSGNIVLDQFWEAKIADFRLSSMGPANQEFSFLISNAVGTIGYCDPLFAETNIFTKESDVYSFGAVLFEVLCGRLCIGKPQDQHPIPLLTTLAQRCYEQGTLDDIMFHGLHEQTEPNSLRTYSSIAYRCLKRDREERPTMDQVLNELELALEYQECFEGGKPMKYENFIQMITMNEGEPLVNKLLQEKRQVLESNPKKHKLDETAQKSFWTRPKVEPRKREEIRRVYIRTDPSDKSLVVKDGYQWRKYGQKVSTRDNPFHPCAYYRCSSSLTCRVKKKVQRSIVDAGVLVVIYAGVHEHGSTNEEAGYALAYKREILTSERESDSPIGMRNLDDSVEKTVACLQKDPHFITNLAAAIYSKILEEVFEDGKPMKNEKITQMITKNVGGPLVNKLMQGKQVSELNPKKRKLDETAQKSFWTRPKVEPRKRREIQRVCVPTDPSDKSLEVKDGYQWRMYGLNRGDPSPRAYYSCASSPTCPVKKKVQRSMDDVGVLVVTYEGVHDHRSTKEEAGYALAYERDILTSERNSNSRIGMRKQDDFVEKMAACLQKNSDFTAKLVAAIFAMILEVDLFQLF